MKGGVCAKVCVLALGYLIVIFFGACSDDDVESRCGLEPEAGPCFSGQKGYYYDKKENKCKDFVWGGCGGVLPFVTLKECQDCVEGK